MTATLFGDPSPAPAGTLAYESDLVQLWRGDALNVLPTYETESLHLLLTDPPYGQRWQSRHRAEQFDQLEGDSGTDDDLAMIRTVLADGIRLISQQRHLYVFGPAQVLDGLKVSQPVELIWAKGLMSGGDLTAPWGPEHERISFAVSKFRHGGKAGVATVPARLRKGSVITCPRPTGRKVRHPSEKPVQLLRELIESSSRFGETVCDPFAGVGSTGVAAVLCGRRAVLVEKDPRYVTIAAERLQRAERLAREAAAL